MADIYVNKDISILTQVALKAFVEVAEKLPTTPEDWKIVNKLTEDIWLNSRLNVKAIEKHSENFNSAEIHAKLERQGSQGSFIKSSPDHAFGEVTVDTIPF
jgi:hypothetical protein